MNTAEPPQMIQVAAPAARSRLAAWLQDPSDDDACDWRPVELGIGTFLMASAGSGGVVGVSPFIFSRLSRSWRLRFSVAAAASPAGPTPTTWAATRIDLCIREPGAYPRRAGLELDVCVGSDLGFSHFGVGGDPQAPQMAQTVPYLSAGP